jgi:hypothetical protein
MGLRGALAVEMDRVCLRGSRVAPEPLGLSGSGINVQPALGPFTDYDPIVNAMALCWAANRPNVSAIVMSPVNIATLAVLSEVPTG